jgi:hypothetical protein
VSRWCSRPKREPVLVLVGESPATNILPPPWPYLAAVERARHTRRFFDSFPEIFPSLCKVLRVVFVLPRRCCRHSLSCQAVVRVSLKTASHGTGRVTLFSWIYHKDKIKVALREYVETPPPPSPSCAAHNA